MSGEGEISIPRSQLTNADIVWKDIKQWFEKTMKSIFALKKEQYFKKQSAGYLASRKYRVQRENSIIDIIKQYYDQTSVSPTCATISEQAIKKILDEGTQTDTDKDHRDDDKERVKDNDESLNRQNHSLEDDVDVLKSKYNDSLEEIELLKEEKSELKNQLTTLQNEIKSLKQQFYQCAEKSNLQQYVISLSDEAQRVWDQLKDKLNDKNFDPALIKILFSQSSTKESVQTQTETDLDSPITIDRLREMMSTLFQEKFEGVKDSLDLRDNQMSTQNAAQSQQFYNSNPANSIAQNQHNAVQKTLPSNTHYNGTHYTYQNQQYGQINQVAPQATGIGQGYRQSQPITAPIQQAPPKKIIFFAPESRNDPLHIKCIEELNYVNQKIRQFGVVLQDINELPSEQQQQQQQNEKTKILVLVTPENIPLAQLQSIQTKYLAKTKKESICMLLFTQSGGQTQFKTNEYQNFWIETQNYSRGYQSNIVQFNEGFSDKIVNIVKKLTGLA